MKKDPRIDAYISKSADFAKPILTHLRKTLHAACPEVEETMKWSSPSFMYKGILCGMAAFKAHCVFGFWHDDQLFKNGGDRNAMERFGRITSLADLPSDKQLTAYIKKAVKLKDEGAVRQRRPAEPRKPLKVPPYLTAALRRNARARAAFEAFSPSHRREYIEWLTEAKTDATREKRLAQAIEWIAEGKSRNWKYER
jgi:uncharacterized protein YdeI (YjbR/CyaY-like superfamily)